jgi:hypothetical protein
VCERADRKSCVDQSINDDTPDPSRGARDEDRTTADGHARTLPRAAGENLKTLLQVEAIRFCFRPPPLDDGIKRDSCYLRVLGSISTALSFRPFSEGS